MHRQILNRWTQAVIWEGEAETIRDAIYAAIGGGADLRGAHLIGADLGGADLGGVAAPVVPHIDAQILAASQRPGCALDMREWHGGDACGTTHCRAGWAITLAGPAGRALEERFGPSVAGALIYAVSRPGQRVPDFYASTEEALADLEAGAAADPLPAQLAWIEQALRYQAAGE